MSRVLALDIGNTATKLACFVDGELAFTEHVPTEVEALGDVQEALPFTVEGVVVASVVPQAQAMVTRLLQASAASETLRVLWLDRATYDTLNTGTVDFSHYQPQALGADRLANAVARALQFPDSRVMVCDVGTTTTFDMVDETGRYLGGAICPGPVKFQSLIGADHAAQLFEVDVFEKPAETPGQTTRACLENGLYYGYKGAMLEIFGNLFVEAGWPLSQVNILFTGGYGRQVREMLTLEIPQAHIDASLTLCGLYQLWALNGDVPAVLKAD